MSVVNPEKAVEAIRKWINERADEAGAKTLVVGLSGGADSALVALLCKGIQSKQTIGVIMPCHSSGVSEARARELANKHDITTIRVDLSRAHDLISALAFDDLREHGLAVERTNDSEGSLRSCLRAPTLDYVAKLTRGVIVGTGNRDEDEVTRYFQKRGDGSVDISPIAKLHKSEVYELLRHLGCTQAILDATPTADLWGPDSGQTDEGQLGITYPEVEWGIRLNDRTNDLVFGLNGEPSTVPVEKIASDLTDRQVKVLSELRRLDRTSRHKINSGIPVFDLRNLTDEKGEKVIV